MFRTSREVDLGIFMRCWASLGHRPSATMVRQGRVGQTSTGIWISPDSDEPFEEHVEREGESLKGGKRSREREKKGKRKVLFAGRNDFILASELKGGSAHF